MENKNKGNISMFIGNDPTDTMIEMCKKWKKRNKGKVIAFDPIDSFARVGLIDYLISINDKDWAKKLMAKDKKGKYKFENSLLILHDYRMLIPGNATPAEFLSLLLHKKRIGMDMMISTMYPKQVHTRISYCVNDWYIFHVDQNISKFSDEITSYVKCQNALMRVNEYVSSNLRLTYEDYPHIIVSDRSDNVEEVNMNPKKNKKLKEVLVL